MILITFKIFVSLTLNISLRKIHIIWIHSLARLDRLPHTLIFFSWFKFLPVNWIFLCIFLLQEAFILTLKMLFWILEFLIILWIDISAMKTWIVASCKINIVYILISLNYSLSVWPEYKLVLRFVMRTLLLLEIHSKCAIL